MVSLVYARILQDALVDGNDADELADALTVIQPDHASAPTPGSS